jgi:predicted DNA-binding transcriptional regulator AlpA
VTAALSQTRPVPRRGLSRDEAAMYCGISATLFDRMVKDGRMPGPKKIDGRRVWDIRSLNVAFGDLPSENRAEAGSSWDDA